MPKIINPLLNITSPAAKGGSNAVYGVDGSPVQHDIFFKSPHDSTEKWHTVLFVPYGRGGSGFSVLDITDPDKPEHLVSIYNNLVQNKVFRMDYANNLFTYDYVATQYALSEVKMLLKLEIILVETQTLFLLLVMILEVQLVTKVIFGHLNCLAL